MIAQRNSGEPYRQFLFCMLRKLQLTIARTEGGNPAAGAGYNTADELIADLRILEDALIEGSWRGSCQRSCAPGAMGGGDLPLPHGQT